MTTEPVDLAQLLTRRQRLYIYAVSFLITKGLAAALAALVVFGDAPRWFLALSAAWGVLAPTEGLAIANVPTATEVD